MNGNREKVNRKKVLEGSTDHLKEENLRKRTKIIKQIKCWASGISIDTLPYL